MNIAPRHGKSELISYLAPAWFLGKYPQKKVIMSSHTADLAMNFGRRVRNLVGSDLYKNIFSQVELQADSKSASRWGTNFNGEYFAIGVGGTVTGKGADLLIIDDPHSEQEAAIAATNPEVYDRQSPSQSPAAPSRTRNNPIIRSYQCSFTGIIIVWSSVLESLVTIRQFSEYSAPAVPPDSQTVATVLTA